MVPFSKREEIPNTQESKVLRHSNSKYLINYKFTYMSTKIDGWIQTYIDKTD